MNKIVLLLFATLLIVACSKSDEMTFIEGTIDDPVENMNSGNANFEGDFISAAHPTSGMAKVNDENTELYFTNFKTDNGPKLLVYLTSDLDVTEYVDLGDLKGVEGNFTYDIPENTDLNKFKYVNIWCVDFSVSFGHAELKKE